MKKRNFILLLIASTFVFALSSCEPEVPEPPKPDEPEPTRYMIGEYYEEGGISGVIFMLDDYEERTSGKIVSLYEVTDIPWTIDAHAITTSTSLTDGLSNMKKIKQMIGWAANFPAFFVCDSVAGSDWYLPVPSEMIALLRVRNQVNDMLLEKGGNIMYFDENSIYWTSVDKLDELNAIGIVKDSLGAPIDSAIIKNTSLNTYVRAVHSFGK